VSVRNLDSLFAPRSIAVIGASNREHSVGAVVTRNLLHGGFQGPVMPVNPRHEAVAGVLAYPDVASLPIVPDLAVIATPPQPIPGIVEELGKRGTPGVIVLTAGLNAIVQSDGRSLEQAMLEAAGRYCVRILGPNCVGLLVPGIGLNASFAHVDAAPGHVAFVSQSGAFCTAVLDWARSRGIGFSHFISLGNSVDVDVGDVLDYLSSDPSTRSILLYLEGLNAARKFMSAGRAASRNKPVIVIKAGRAPEGARAAASHTGAMAAHDDVFDAAFRRAGMLRVDRIDELFDAAETLARAQTLGGDRLLIVGNGGGPGVMATDALIAGGGRLAELSSELHARLATVLPATWSRANPIDLVGDATGSRYLAALREILSACECDAILVLHAPTAIASGREAARAVADVLAEVAAPIPLFTSWLGGEGAEGARQILRRAGVPTYDTPEDAVRAFLHMVTYQRSQELLRETPPALLENDPADTAGARVVIAQALDSGREWLTEPDAKHVLEAYGVPTVPTTIARDAEEAAQLATRLGFPIALKILSPDITHKSDIGGVALDLESEAAVRGAAQGMARRVGKEAPNARLEGFVVQPMARRPGAHELIVGATTDRLFGPVVLFGAGGTAVEVLADRSVALLPLNLNVARRLVAQTRISRLLAGYRNKPAADIDAIYRTLTRVSQLLVDLPEIRELDINPLLVDHRGVIALDARLRVGPAQGRAPLAIRPYPNDLEETLDLPTGERVVARPIRPEDEPAHRAFFARLDADDVYFRFFNMVREMPHSELARYTQIDYDREMAFIAYLPETPDETLGVVRAVADPDNECAEFAVIVRSDTKGHGLGRALLEKLVRYSRDRGLRELTGQVLSRNRLMLSLARELGFQLEGDPVSEVVVARLALQPE
jgi:acetyltransferase